MREESGSAYQNRKVNTLIPMQHSHSSFTRKETVIPELTKDSKSMTTLEQSVDWVLEMPAIEPGNYEDSKLQYKQIKKRIMRILNDEPKISRSNIAMA